MADKKKPSDLESADTGQERPGHLLRSAREAKGMTTAEVAKQLRLHEQWIVNIENDDYSRAAAWIYVRGYLRAYARFLDVSEERVMTAFDALNLEEAFAEAKKNSQEKIVLLQQVVPVFSGSTQFMSRRAVGWGSVLIVSGLLLLGGVWWQSQKKHPMNSALSQLPIQPQKSSREKPMEAQQVVGVPPAPNKSGGAQDETVLSGSY